MSRRDGAWLKAREKQLRERLYRLFKKQMLWVLLNYPKPPAIGTNSVESLFKIETNTYEFDIDKMLANLPFDADIADIIIRFMGMSAIRGSETGVQDLGDLGVSWNLKNPKVVKLLRAKRDLELSQRDGTITYTTRQKIKEILIKGADQGLSYGAIGKLIRDQGTAGVFSKARSELISITEIGRAYGEGQAGVIEDFLARYPDRQIEKHWIDVGDNKVRTTHRQNTQDGWIPWHQPFSGTNEQHAPSQDFRCRCTFRTRIKEEASMVKLPEAIEEVRQDTQRVVDTLDAIQSHLEVEEKMTDKIDNVHKELVEQEAKTTKELNKRLDTVNSQRIKKESKIENFLTRKINNITELISQRISTLKVGLLSQLLGLKEDNDKEHGEIVNSVKSEIKKTKVELKKEIKKNQLNSTGLSKLLPSALKAKLIVKLLQSLKGDERLDAKYIKNVGKYASAFIAAGSGQGVQTGGVLKQVLVKQSADNYDTAWEYHKEAVDHDAAATDQLVNVCYGTGSPPAANTTTIGALFIQYS